ncbi:DUF975 family protein [Patescibacteria group bacterium]|nr:MAG: DUF975 family protein [Patescibacteria group bacterium]
MTPRFSIGTAFSRGWEAFAKRPLFFIGVLFLIFVVAAAMQIPSVIINALTPENVGKIDAAVLPFVLVGAWVSILFAFAGWAVQQYLSTGVMRLTLDAVLGRPYTLKSLLVEPIVFLNALLASIIVGFLVLIGLLLFIIPGIYVSLAFTPIIYVVLDQKVGAVEAVQRCWNLTKGNRGRIFLFGLAAFGINLLGVLALGVGLLVTVPLTWLAMADVYRQLAEKKA